MHCNMVGETLVLSLHVSVDLRVHKERPQFLLHDIFEGAHRTAPRRSTSFPMAVFSTAAGRFRRPYYCNGRSTAGNAVASRLRRYHFSSIVNCPGPVDFAVQVVDLPASDAALPLATSQVPFPEPFHPVTLRSAMVRAIFASES